MVRPYLSRNSRRNILPTGVLGNLNAEFDHLGLFVAGQVGFAIGTHGASVSVASFFTTTSFTASPVLSSGTPTTAHSITPGHLCHHVFHLVGVDVEATDKHHVFLAVHDLEEATLVHHAHIAGFEVTVRVMTLAVSSGRCQ
jgi:hypothetical protein